MAALRSLKSEWPDGTTKHAGDFVRNVHPCNAGRMPDGVVLGVEPDTDAVSVKVGRGSHVYGPAQNWRVIESKPEWLTKE